MAAQFPLYVPLIGRDNLTPTLNKVHSRLKAVGAQVGKVGKAMSTKLTLPAVAMGAAAFNSGAQFEKAMNRVRALSGATGADLKSLRDQAQDLGSTTVHSATQAAEAQGLLAQAGFSTVENLQTLPSVMNLASAGSLELADASSTLADVLRGYGLEATQSSRVADVLSKAQASANVTVLELGEAFKMAGPLAGAAGIDFEETAAMLAIMADKGFKASMGGTAVRNMLLKLGKPSAEAKKALAELGIEKDSILNADGTVKSWKGLVRAFQESEATIPQLNAIFGERAVGPFQAMLTAGADQLEAMEAKMLSAHGDAERTAREIMEGSAGATARFRSALEGFALKLGESGFLDQVAAGISVVTDFLSRAAALEPGLLRTGTTIVFVSAALGPMLSAVGVGIKVFGLMTLGASKFFTVLKLGWALMRLNPMGLLVTAGIALAGVAVTLWKKWDSTLGFWGNVRSVFWDLATNVFGKLMGALRKVASWVLPKWAKKLLGIEKADPVAVDLPSGGGPPAAPGTGGGNPFRGAPPAAPGVTTTNNASVEIRVKSDNPGAYEITDFDAGGANLTLDQGVAMGAVTG